MRYLYKQTGVIVDSAFELDAAVFTPLASSAVKKPAEAEKEKPAEKPVKQTATRKPAASTSKTTARRTTKK